MMDINAKQPGDNVIAVEEVPWADVSRYGVVGYSQVNGGTMAIQEMIEKPAHGDAPSNCIISGRYILQPEIFSKIAALKPGAGGEIQLTDALVALMEEQDFWGFKFERETYDCGDKLGFLLANVAYGLDREDIGPAFRGSLAGCLANAHARAIILSQTHSRLCQIGTGANGLPLNARGRGTNSP